MTQQPHLARCDLASGSLKSSVSCQILSLFPNPGSLSFRSPSPRLIATATTSPSRVSQSPWPAQGCLACFSTRHQAPATVLQNRAPDTTTAHLCYTRQPLWRLRAWALGLEFGTPKQPVEGQVTLMGSQMPWKPATLAT